MVYVLNNTNIFGVYYIRLNLVIIMSKITVRDFYADWCQPCKMIAPHMEKLESNFPEIVIEKINVDSNSDLAAIYEVRNIPLVVVEKDGKIVEKVVGAKPYKFYEELINQYND